MLCAREDEKLSTNCACALTSSFLSLLSLVADGRRRFSYNGKQLAQGREKAKSALESDPALADAIERQVREHLAATGAVPLVGGDETVSVDESAGDEDDPVAH